MNRTELYRLARLGAQARLATLQEEMETILRAFPDLRGGSAPGATQPVRGRRTMSAAARKAISLRQKRRWAEWRTRKSAGKKE